MSKEFFLSPKQYFTPCIKKSVDLWDKHLARKITLVEVLVVTAWYGGLMH
jgi:hypothetical protein